MQKVSSLLPVQTLGRRSVSVLDWRVDEFGSLENFSLHLFSLSSLTYEVFKKFFEVLFEFFRCFVVCPLSATEHFLLQQLVSQVSVASPLSLSSAAILNHISFLSFPFWRASFFPFVGESRLQFHSIYWPLCLEEHWPYKNQPMQNNSGFCSDFVDSVVVGAFHAIHCFSLVGLMHYDCCIDEFVHRCHGCDVQLL